MNKPPCSTRAAERRRCGELSPRYIGKARFVVYCSCWLIISGLAPGRRRRPRGHGEMLNSLFFRIDDSPPILWGLTPALTPAVTDSERICQPGPRHGGRSSKAKPLSYLGRANGPNVRTYDPRTDRIGGVAAAPPRLRLRSQNLTDCPDQLHGGSRRPRKCTGLVPTPLATTE